MRTVETLDGKLERMKWENGRLEIEVAHLKAENRRYREALERIENECSRHDTTAWSIASDALEGMK